MKKRVLFISVIILIVLFFTLPRILEPDKVLVVGHQISEYVYEFTTEIKEKEKVAEYEKWFDELEFYENSELDTGNQSDYADIIVQIRHKEGIATHLISIWIDGEDVTAVNGIGSSESTAKITDNQLRNLQTIIE